jgi:secondary thiamine-phosphate synthase enzyme
MRQASDRLTVDTRGKGLTEITRPVADWVARARIGTGLLTLFCRHTSCSLVIQENADPDVRTDLEAYFERIAPEGGGYIHDAEGADDMPAHIRGAGGGRCSHAGHLAGHLSLRTPAAAAPAGNRASPHRRIRKAQGATTRR